MYLKGQGLQVCWSYDSTLTMQTAWQTLKHWTKDPLKFCLTASPLIFFQSPSAEFRFILRAMAVTAPVWRDCTSVTMPSPAAAPRASFPRKPLLPRYTMEPRPWLGIQSAAVFEKFSPRGAILKWPQREVGCFFTNCWPPGDKMCLDLAPAPWKLAVTRDRGPVQRGNLYVTNAAICSAMPQYQKYGSIVSKKSTFTTRKFRFRFGSSTLL